MASSMLVRAALPSDGGRRRLLGSGRLPLAVLPGQGAAVLAVRRNGTGGLHSVEFVKVTPKRSVWAVKATFGESDQEGGDSDEFELVRELKERLDREISKPRSMKINIFDPVDVQSAYYQMTLRDCAKSGVALWATVANRFRPPTESKLYEGLKLVGETLVNAVVLSSDSRGTWKTVCDVVEAHDRLRRLVSSALEAPLPIDWTPRWDAARIEGHAEDFTLAEWGLILVLDRTVALVNMDIKSMLGTN